jgi:Ca-activated chloride channel family protein
MRKTTGFLLVTILLSFAQISYAQTRPRRVGNPASPPPTATPVDAGTDDPTVAESPSSTPARPPVLRGTINGNQTGPSKTAPASEEPATVGEGDIVRVNTTLVSVPVSVMDRDGKYVPNIRKEEFHIFEDGVEQKVAYFASVEKPFTVALMLDTSGSTTFKLEDIQDGAIAFVDQLNADDKVMVVSFDDRIRVLAEPTSDRAALRRAIRNTRPGNGTRLYDAVAFVMKRLESVSGRKAVVLFTDGVDTTSRHESYDSTVRQAEEMDGLIYTVDFDTYQDVASHGGGGGSSQPSILGGILGSIILGGHRGGRSGGGWPGGGGAGSSREEYEKADRYLHELPDKTGARFYSATTMQNMAQAFSLVAEELRRQYSLGYYPKVAAQAGQRRSIRVRVDRPNLAVRARDNYVYDPHSATAQQQSAGQSPAQPPPVLHFDGLAEN